MRALPWLLLGASLGLLLVPAAAAAEPLDIVLHPLEEGCDPDDASPCWETPFHVVPLGAQVALRIDREGAQMPHNLHVLEPVDEATPVELGGVSEPIVFDAAEVGRFEFVCDLHPETMYGWIDVQHPGRTTDESGTTDEPDTATAQGEAPVPAAGLPAALAAVAAAGALATRRARR